MGNLSVRSRAKCVVQLVEVLHHESDKFRVVAAVVGGVRVVGIVGVVALASVHNSSSGRLKIKDAPLNPLRQISKRGSKCKINAARVTLKVPGRNAASK